MSMTENDDRPRNGALRSVGSPRAYDYESVRTVDPRELPEEYTISCKPDVLDQGWINSCVAHGIAECLQANAIRRYGEGEKMSVVLIYGLWRGSFTGEGMYPETALKNGREIGTAERYVAPENLEVPDAIKRAEYYKREYPNAFRYKVAQYFKISRSAAWDNIRCAIYQYDLPVLIVTDDGLNRHCEIAIGWDAEKLIIQNSYGEYEKTYHRVKADKIEEAYVVLSEEEKIPFDDVKGHWAEKAIKNLFYADLIKGIDESHFAPDEPITRAQAAQLVDNCMKRIEEKLAEKRE